LDLKAARKQRIRVGDGHHEESRWLGTADELEAPGALAERAQEGGSVRASLGGGKLDADVLGFGACPRRKNRRSE
jgi:hypothetical protein